MGTAAQSRKALAVRTHVNPHGGLKLMKKHEYEECCVVRTHVNPHGGLKLREDLIARFREAAFGPTLILTED